MFTVLRLSGANGTSNLSHYKNIFYGKKPKDFIFLDSMNVTVSRHGFLFRDRFAKSRGREKSSMASRHGAYRVSGVSG